MKRPAVSLTRRTAYVSLCPVGFVVLYSQKATRDLLGASAYRTTSTGILAAHDNQASDPSASADC